MANVKITGLPALAATPDDADVLEIVDDVAGTPTSKKVTVAELRALADKVVIYAKIQDISATNKLLGRSTAGAGVIEEIACTAAGRALLDDADAAAQRATLSAAKSGANSDITSMSGFQDAIVAFAGSAGQTITHNLGHTDYRIIINPVADPGGFLGEVWISKAANTAVVYNSGSAAGNLDYVIIPAA